MKRLTRLARIRRRQQQVAAARVQQQQARVQAQTRVVQELQAAVQTGTRAGEIETLAEAAAEATAALELAQAWVVEAQMDLTRRAFALRRAEQLLKAEREEQARADARRDQQAMDDRFARRTG